MPEKARGPDEGESLKKLFPITSNQRLTVHLGRTVSCQMGDFPGEA